MRKAWISGSARGGRAMGGGAGGGKHEEIHDLSSGCEKRGSWIRMRKAWIMDPWRRAGGMRPQGHD